jgi:hypothetical protein
MPPTPDHPKAILHLSTVIDATFGNQIQRDVSVTVLKGFLDA